MEELIYDRELGLHEYDLNNDESPFPIGMDTVMRAAMGKSAPFLAIAKHFKVPYWVVLCYADPQVAPVWRDAAEAEIKKRFQWYRSHNLRQAIFIVAYRLSQGKRAWP